MKAKRLLTTGLVVAMGAVTVLAGCGNKGAEEGNASGSATKEQETQAGGATGAINVISREDGSGTRGAFIELFGIEQKDADGNKVDYTTLTAEITNSTAVMMTTVQGNANAIGYISLGSLNSDVKALSVDGVAPSADAVKDGSYAVARPFNIVYKEAALDDVAKDFITYIMSAEGQAVVEDNGYVSQGNEGAYTAAGVSGDLTIGGSSSVTPVMEKLAESYKALNPDVNIEVQQTDSTTGITSAAEGVCNIGMASRNLKDEEGSLGLTAKVIAMDGIAVIVNNDNALDNITKEQVRAIFMGEITSWEEVK